MVNLYDEYNEFLKEGDWLYYDDLKNQYSNKNINYLLENAEEFIEAYFKSGLKGGALNRSLLSKLKAKRRLPHVVSTFILGIILTEKLVILKKSLNKKCQKFQRLLDEELNKNELNSLNLKDPFLYTWFLTCLGHDIGYLFECEDETKKPSLLVSDIDNIDNWLSYSNLDMKNYLPPNDHNTIPKKLKNNCINYYKASIEDGDKFRDKNCRDHGISGGIVYYNLLKNNYIRIKNNKNSDYFIENDRLWSKTVLETYIAAGSWAIICHNMWIINKNDTNNKKVKIYESEIPDLISDKPLIKVSKHPFLFLLTLADSLEPIKEFKELNSKNFKKLLQETKISFEENRFCIEKHPNKEIDLKYLLEKSKDIKFFEVN